MTASRKGPQLYKVVRVHKGQNARTVIEKDLTEEQAQGIIQKDQAGNPDTTNSMLIYTKQ